MTLREQTVYVISDKDTGCTIATWSERMCVWVPQKRVEEKQAFLFTREELEQFAREAARNAHAGKTIYEFLEQKLGE